MQEMFAMIMMVDMKDSTIPFPEFSDRMTKLGESMNMSIHTMHEDIFNSMHKI